MPLPFHLQKLPPEALDLLRFMGTHSGPHSAETMEESGLSIRLIGKAVRRLINAGYLAMNTANNLYDLTTEGKKAAQEIAEYDVAEGGEQTESAPPTEVFPRRLTVVLPRAIPGGQASDLFFGINPPQGEGPMLPNVAHVDLKLSAVNGSLSSSVISLEIPPDRAATPVRILLTPAQVGKPCRVRVDVFQSLDVTVIESLGGMYFDVPVAAQSSPTDATSRAVGMDLSLQAPR
jgi:hypothetical protein